MSDYDDIPSPRDVTKHGIRYGIAFLFILFVLGWVAWGLGVFTKVATKPVDTAVGIVDRVLDPDHALQTYRWFHEARQQVEAKKGQISIQKSALEAAAEDRKEARRVELVGLQQNCMNLVSEYNAKANRADTVIFQHPERFLPGDWPGDRSPLPSSLPLTACN